MLNPITYTERVVGDFLKYQLSTFAFADARLDAQHTVYGDALEPLVRGARPDDDARPARNLCRVAIRPCGVRPRIFRVAVGHAARLGRVRRGAESDNLPVGEDGLEEKRDGEVELSSWAARPPPFSNPVRNALLRCCDNRWFGAEFGVLLGVRSCVAIPAPLTPSEEAYHACVQACISCGCGRGERN